MQNLLGGQTKSLGSADPVVDGLFHFFARADGAAPEESDKSSLAFLHFYHKR